MTSQTSVTVVHVDVGDHGGGRGAGGWLERRGTSGCRRQGQGPSRHRCRGGDDVVRRACQAVGPLFLARWRAGTLVPFTYLVEDRRRPGSAWCSPTAPRHLAGATVAHQRVIDAIRHRAVPRPCSAVHDDAVNGAFYVMEYVDGAIVHTADDIGSAAGPRRPHQQIKTIIAALVRPCASTSTRSAWPTCPARAGYLDRQLKRCIRPVASRPGAAGHGAPARPRWSTAPPAPPTSSARLPPGRRQSTPRHGTTLAILNWSCARSATPWPTCPTCWLLQSRRGAGHQGAVDRPPSRISAAGPTWPPATPKLSDHPSTTSTSGRPSIPGARPPSARACTTARYIDGRRRQAPRRHQEVRPGRRRDRHRQRPRSGQAWRPGQRPPGEARPSRALRPSRRFDLCEHNLARSQPSRESTFRVNVVGLASCPPTAMFRTSARVASLPHGGRPRDWAGADATAEHALSTPGIAYSCPACRDGPDD